MDYWERCFSSGPEFQALLDDEDMEEFRSEKSVKTGKSPEEIQKLMVNESLSDMERSCLLISTGQDVQKICVIEHLPDLLQQHQMETLGRVLPKICDLLPMASQEIQIVASQVLGDVVQKKLIPVHIFISTCLNTVLTQLEAKDPTVSRAWLGTVLSSISVLPKEELKKKILSIAISKGQLSQTVSSRQASCLILGEVAKRFESVWLKRELLPLATSLCQDVDSQVRELMCEQLNTLARALGPEVSEESLLPELVELMNDEETRVRVAALGAMTDLVSLWSEECVRKVVVPLVIKFCESAAKANDPQLMEGVATYLGRLCYEMRDKMSADNLKWFISYYCQLSKMKSKDPTPQPLAPSASATTIEIQNECRRLCAYNFPAMLTLVGGEAYKQQLSSTFEELARDECCKVRRTIACGFHEVVNILGKRSSQVSHIFQNFLRDKPDVLTGLVTNLSSTLQYFAQGAHLAPETNHPGMPEFIAPLIAFDQVAASYRQWRLHRDFLTALASLVSCMTSDQIHSKFSPLLCRHISEKGVLPVKQAAAHTLCIFIRHNRRQEQRNELITWIIEECAKHPNCRMRLLFIDICNYLLDMFSRNFFKVNFFDSLLQLAQDPVINIRLRLCQLYPTLKSILKLPTDRVLLQNLELTVRKLISQERDPDAAQTIREAVIAMDRIEVAMETLTRKTFFESDLSDQQKELEEKALILSEEKEKEKNKMSGKKSASRTSKPGSSPRDRDSTRINLTTVGGNSGSASPAILPKNALKNRQTPKTISAPSSTIDLVQGGGAAPYCPSPSLSHSQMKGGAGGGAGGGGGRSKRGGAAAAAGEGGVKEKASGSSTNRTLSANTDHSPGSRSPRLSPKIATTSASASSKSVSKKKGQSYGLEYSKAKKRT